MPKAKPSTNLSEPNYFTATPAGLEVAAGSLTRARAKALKSIFRKGRPYSQEEDGLLQKLATERLLWGVLKHEFEKVQGPHRRVGYPRNIYHRLAQVEA
jgi:hypothetical protein